MCLRLRPRRLEAEGVIVGPEGGPLRVRRAGFVFSLTKRARTNKTPRVRSARTAARLFWARPSRDIIIESEGATSLQAGEFTVLFRECTSGNKEALDALTPVVYAELRKLAMSCMRVSGRDIHCSPRR